MCCEEEGGAGGGGLDIEWKSGVEHRREIYFSFNFPFLLRLRARHRTATKVEPARLQFPQNRHQHTTVHPPHLAHPPAGGDKAAVKDQSMQLQQKRGCICFVTTDPCTSPPTSPPIHAPGQTRGWPPRESGKWPEAASQAAALEVPSSQGKAFTCAKFEGDRRVDPKD